MSYCYVFHLFLSCSPYLRYIIYFCFFFFNDTATTEIYTLSLHDALPISDSEHEPTRVRERLHGGSGAREARDRKSTRPNSSHANISYAVFCLKKKKKKKKTKIIIRDAQK